MRAPLASPASPDAAAMALVERRYDAAVSLAMDGFGILELYAPFPGGVCSCPSDSPTRDKGVCRSPGKLSSLAG